MGNNFRFIILHYGYFCFCLNYLKKIKIILKIIFFIYIINDSSFEYDYP